MEKNVTTNQLFRLFRLCNFAVNKPGNMEAILGRTTRKDQQIAQSALLKMHETSEKIRRVQNSTVSIKVQDRKEALIIPKKALVLLFDILSNMADGKSITLIPSDAELSTQQAADLLNVSRPHIVTLLEKGAIPFRKVGAHRRIALKDLIAYDKKLKKNRAEKLAFLSKQAQELNLGYK